MKRLIAIIISSAATYCWGWAELRLEIPLTSKRTIAGRYEQFNIDVSKDVDGWDRCEFWKVSKDEWGNIFAMVECFTDSGARVRISCSAIGGLETTGFATLMGKSYKRLDAWLVCKSDK